MARTFSYRWPLGVFGATLLAFLGGCQPSSARPDAARAVEVRFANPADHVTLAGTLTLPAGPGPHPAVILVTGAGPQDRNETILGHQPFRVIAEHLTARGYAVLRYDDRGVGASTGNFAQGATPDFARDAQAALAYVRQRPEIDTRRIGLLGHSEGGLVVARVARAHPDQVAFLILLASPGMPGDAFYLEQDATEARVRGVDEASIAKSREIKQTMFAVLKEDTTAEVCAERLRATLRAMPLSDEERQQIASSGMSMDTLIDQQIRQLNTPAFRFFLRQDPRDDLQTLTMPVLALTGSKDVQVPAHASLPFIKAALTDGPCPRFELKVLPEVNHLLQTAGTGLPDEYANIEETVAPVVLTSLTSWLDAVVGTGERVTGP